MKYIIKESLAILVFVLIGMILIFAVVGIIYIVGGTSGPEIVTVIETEIVTDTIILPTKDYETIDLPEVCGSMKTYMDYRTITDRTSKQYYLQQLATTDADGFRRVNNYYLVAVGSYYSTQIGQELLIVLEDGKVLNAMVGDLKQDRHTDSSNRYVEGNGNIVEFIVDTDVLSKDSIRSGDVSRSGLSGRILRISEVK